MPDDNVRLLALNKVLEFLLSARLPPGASFRDLFAVEGWVVELSIRPAGREPDPLAADEVAQPKTPCERDVYAIIAASNPRPITGPSIVAELERRGMWHGRSTVFAVLARMAHLGWIKNHRSGPRSGHGYTLPPPEVEQNPPSNTLFDP